MGYLPHPTTNPRKRGAEINFSAPNFLLDKGFFFSIIISKLINIVKYLDKRLV